MGSAWPSSPWASLKLKQRQLPILRLILTFFMEATTALDIIMEATMATQVTMDITSARGLLKLKLKLPLLLRPRLKLIPGTDTTVDMVMDTTGDMVLDTTADTTVDT